MSNKITGIYYIKNIINNKIYVGQSTDYNKRKRVHLNNLRKNKETNPHLQRAWNKYGEENFIFSIIQECSIEDIHLLEIFFIKELNAHYLLGGYNISHGGDAPMRNRTHSDETKKKMSYDRSGERNKRRGFIMSDEQKKKLSEDRIGEKHWMYGKKHKPETIEKMRQNNKRTALGKKYSKKMKKEQSKRLVGKNHKNKISTTYIGVSFHKESNKWRARLFYKNKEVYLGLFEKEVDAALKYDIYSWKYFHRKELLNFPENIAEEQKNELR